MISFPKIQNHDDAKNQFCINTAVVSAALCVGSCRGCMGLNIC